MLPGNSAEKGASHNRTIIRMEHPRRIPFMLHEAAHWAFAAYAAPQRQLSSGHRFFFLKPARGGIQVSESKVELLPQSHPEGAAALRPLRIAILGFGTVGSSVARILTESKPHGLQLTHVFNRGVARKRVTATTRKRDTN